MSWFDDDEGKRKTIIFANRAIIKKIGRTKLVFGDGHEVTLIEQWKGVRRRKTEVISKKTTTT